MSELRRDPITGRYVVVAPEQTRRARDFTPPPHTPSDPARCPFCEGREAIAGRELLAWRADGQTANGVGWDLRVVPNREPLLQVESDLGESVAGGLFHRFGNLGAHEVVIESPRHDATWSTLPPEAIWRVLWAWRERIADLKRDVRLKSFVVVKNHGAAAGAKQDHAHSQLFAYPFAPPTLERELASSAEYFAAEKRCVFCDLIAEETATTQRVIAVDDHTVTLAPYAPRLPFETWVFPRAHAAFFEESNDGLLLAVATRLHDLVQRLDRTLLEPPFNLVLHTAPMTETAKTSYHWHIEVVPRLGPVSGVEWGSGVYINPITPEESAEVLRTAAPPGGQVGG